MKSRLALALVAGLLAAPALADTVVVNENFDSYADDAAFQAAWVPTTGNGTLAANAADVTSGILTSDSVLFPGLQGKAADHIGATASTPGQVNQWGGIINQPNAQNPAFHITPSATQSVFLSADIYNSGHGNERMTVGLRYIDASTAPVTTQNILELGFYNSNSADPTVVGSANPASGATVGSPGFYAGTGYAYRLINFGPVAAPLLHQTDWQYPALPNELDRTTDADSIVNIADVGAGWHRYTATITPDTVTITIDLFRDGLRNTSKTPDGVTGIRPGTPGVDATVSWGVSATANGFNSLRFGGPSGLSSAGNAVPFDAAFDNILLKLVDNVVVPPNTADFNKDGTVDGADLLIWQKGLGINDGTALQGDGDATGDGNVTAADLAAWQAKFGGPPATAAFGAVPEPASAMLAFAGLVALAAKKRNRRS